MRINKIKKVYNNIDWYLENFRSSKSSKKFHTEMYGLFFVIKRKRGRYK